MAHEITGLINQIAQAETPHDWAITVLGEIATEIRRLRTRPAELDNLAAHLESERGKLLQTVLTLKGVHR